MVLPNEIREQIEEAYREMTEKADYHAAAGDGMGYVYPEEIDIPKQAAAYAEMWWKEEDAHKYRLGCPSHGGRKPLIFAVEACRLMNGMNYPLALKLLKLASDETQIAMAKHHPPSKS